MVHNYIFIQVIIILNESKAPNAFTSKLHLPSVYKKNCLIKNNIIRECNKKQVQQKQLRYTGNPVFT